MFLGAASLWKFTPVPQDSAAPRPLKQINQYLLRQKIGRGGTVRVYLGVDERTGQSYALKRIKLSELVGRPSASRSSSGKSG
jgi:serine/threonine protein kinase